MIARGASMHPFLPDGTPVLLRPRSGRTLRIGEIILVPWGNDVALHRVVRVRDGVVSTRGDGCPFEDPPVALAAVKGVAIHALRRGRSLPLDGPGMRALGWLLARSLPWVWRIRAALSS